MSVRVSRGLGLILCLACAGAAQADPIDDARLNMTPGVVNAGGFVGLPLGGPAGGANLINLFTPAGTTFGTATSFSVAGWVATTGTGGNFFQVRTLSGAPSSVHWLQDFVAPLGSTTADFAWQSTIWNYGTGTPGAITYGAGSAFDLGASTFTGAIEAGSAAPGPAYFANGGAAGFVAPVPEPSSVLIGALGAGLLGLRRWRRRATVAAAP